MSTQDGGMGEEILPRIWEDLNEVDLSPTVEKREYRIT